mmetsp:Transcript_27637/g.62664  ORF Transcript_27637/g.62664 Transcript_27637/m.62664 type:complete len:209 (+) Transcript_27637:989-1615(+)
MHGALVRGRPQHLEGDRERPLPLRQHVVVAHQHTDGLGGGALHRLQAEFDQQVLLLTRELVPHASREHPPRLQLLHLSLGAHLGQGHPWGRLVRQGHGDVLGNHAEQAPEATAKRSRDSLLILHIIIYTTRSLIGDGPQHLIVVVVTIAKSKYGEGRHIGYLFFQFSHQWVSFCDAIICHAVSEKENTLDFIMFALFSQVHHQLSSLE